jgi:antitoxin (DNA-binding transcriptional repressor) of toxin-antitoxin stability system
MNFPQEELGEDRLLQSVGMAAYYLVNWGRLRKGVRGKNRQTSGERSTAVVQIAVVEAQQRLPELLNAVEAGEEVEIRAENGRTYRLAPSRPRPPVTGLPKAGSCKGLFVAPADFKEPLEELREYME